MGCIQSGRLDTGKKMPLTKYMGTATTVKTLFSELMLGTTAVALRAMG